MAEKEYIERADAMNAVLVGNIDKDFPRMDIAARLHDIPAADVRSTEYCEECRAALLETIDHYKQLCADVRPVVRGKWKKRMEEKETPYYKSFTPIWFCSECGTEYDPSLCTKINFCYTCGADMREES